MTAHEHLASMTEVWLVRIERQPRIARIKGLDDLALPFCDLQMMTVKDKHIVTV